MTIAHRLTRKVGTFQSGRVACGAEFTNMAKAIADNNLLPFAKLFGFTELPPAPGEVASWTYKDWIEWGNRNNMPVVDKSKHGYRIYNENRTDIAVHPSGTPGDVRAGMNCGADFRRAFKDGMARRWCRFAILAHWMYFGDLLIDGSVQTLEELAVRTLPECDDADLAVARDQLRLTDPSGLADSRVAKVSVSAVSNAISYLAKCEESCTYADVVLKANKAVGLTHGMTQEGATNLVKTITDLRRSGQQEMEVPVAHRLVFQYMLDTVEESKQARMAEREAKREARAAEKVARQVTKLSPTTKTPLERFNDDVAATRSAILEHIERYGHELGQLSNRHSKVLEAVASIRMPAPSDIIQENAELRRKLDEASAEIERLQDAIEAAKDGSDDRVQHVRGLLENFAQTVYTKLSVKDFLEIAQGIREILPISERYALGDIEEHKPNTEMKAQ